MAGFFASDPIVHVLIHSQNHPQAHNLHIGKKNKLLSPKTIEHVAFLGEERIKILWNGPSW